MLRPSKSPQRQCKGGGLETRYQKKTELAKRWKIFKDPEKSERGTLEPLPLERLEKKKGGKELD